MPPPDDLGYSYDVFISYPRRLYAEGDDATEHACGEWLRLLFLSFFKSCLSDELPISPRVFLDVEDLPAGVQWLDVLGHALVTSRCLVPVWSASYFRSRYCLWEWGSFQKRGEGLVVPIGWTKPKPFFPKAALDTAHFDFSEYAFPNPAYLNTPDGVGLQRLIREFAARVAEVVMAVPACAPEDDRFVLPKLPSRPERQKIPLMRLGGGNVMAQCA